MFFEEALGKIKFRASPKRVVHEFYRLKTLITFEKVNTTEWSKKKIRKLRWSGVVNFHCMQMACDEHAVYFRR